MSIIDFLSELETTKDIELLRKYYNSENIIHRIYVARNINCPIEILEKLSDDENIHIMLSLVNNENFPFSLLKKIYKNDFFYRSLIEKHPNWKLSDFE